MASSPELLMTAYDYALISSLLESSRDLECELRRATIVPQASLPHDVVTVGSRVRFVRVESGRVGQTTQWPVPGGKTKSIRVLSVSLQPEALGAYDL